MAQFNYFRASAVARRTAEGKGESPSSHLGVVTASGGPELTSAQLLREPLASSGRPSLSCELVSASPQRIENLNVPLASLGLRVWRATARTYGAPSFFFEFRPAFRQPLSRPAVWALRASIPSFRIRDQSVERFIPRRAAAPCGPARTQSVRCSARRM